MGNNSTLQAKLIKALQCNAIGGHSGPQATYQRLTMFYWKGMKHGVDEFIKQCAICQRAKHLNVHPMGFMQQLVVPEGVRQDLCWCFLATHFL